MKRLVVCCDGTWNRPDHVDRGVAAPTNVAKLGAGGRRARRGRRRAAACTTRPGVGTRRAERLLGGGFGVGLSHNVHDCYRFLVDNYEPGDELYFFGFSRGAFTARSTAGLVRNAGILRREDARPDRGGVRALPQPATATPSRAASPPSCSGARYSHPETPIDFIGVWDTVGALGIPIDGLRPPLLTRRWTLPRHRAQPHRPQRLPRARDRRAARAVQADALGAAGRRGADQALEQVWFAGVHCDVGGGYRDPALSEIPLLWMADSARDCGLAFDLEVAGDALGPLHDSCTGFYRRLPRHVRQLVGTVEGSISPTVDDRCAGADLDPAYLPGSVAAWRDALAKAVA